MQNILITITIRNTTDLSVGTERLKVDEHNQSFKLGTGKQNGDQPTGSNGNPCRKCHLRNQETTGPDGMNNLFGTMILLAQVSVQNNILKQ